MEKRKNRWIAILSSVLFLSVGVGAGFAIGRFSTKLPDDEQKIVDEYRLLKEEWLFGNEAEYLDQLAAQGVVLSASNSLNDPYTFYTSTYAGQGLATDGKGFGFTSHYYDGGIYVREVYTNSTAYKANLRAGDILYSVRIGDEETFSFKEHTLDEINKKLSSVEDTTTHFLFTGKRKNKDSSYTEISIDMTRGDYEEDYVTLVSTPNVENDYTMTIKINTFLGKPALALEGILKSSSTKIKNLVLDLRGNGGGYVSQAAEMAKLFVKKNTLIYQLKNKNDEIIEQMTQKKDPEFQIENYKIVMDGNTASASEIFALAMLSLTNCQSYGLKSYGKGIAQSFKTFSDGSVLRYTYAYVYGPNGEDTICIHKKGITPINPYAFDYSFLGSSMDYSSIGISEYGQNHFLKVLNAIYPDAYPSEYSKDYHFTSAIQDYAKNMAVKYEDASLLVGFNEKGGMLKSLNDILNKEAYDKYLEYEDDVIKTIK